jgi:hypothetical protein
MVSKENEVKPLEMAKTMLELKTFNSLLLQLKWKIFRFIDPMSLNYKLISTKGPKNNLDNELEVVSEFKRTTFNPKGKNIVIKDWRETKKVVSFVNRKKVVSSIPLPDNEKKEPPTDEEIINSLLAI